MSANLLLRLRGRDVSVEQVARLEEDLSTRTRAVHMLEEKLASQADYDEIKREFR